MPESFGARLRHHREELHISLGSVADQTKIKLSLLEGLERDDVSHWPSGIFRRAYIRAYAHAIGLNPDAIVREFLEIHPDQEAFDAAAAIAAAADRARPGGPPSRLRNMVGSAIESLSRLRRNAAIDEHGGSEPVPAAGTTTWPQAHLRVAADDDGHAFEPATDASVAHEPEPWEADPPVAAHRLEEDHAGRLPIGTAGAAPTVEAGPREPVPPPDLPSDHERRSTDEPIPVAGAAPADPDEQEAFEPDMIALADLCTRLGRVEQAAEMQPLLHEAAGILGATGLIVWLWNRATEQLKPVLAHGYSDKVLAQLPGVPADADNATAAAYRLAQPCAIEGRSETNGALVVPLLMPSGCAGVLALELLPGTESLTRVRAAATIVAALMAQLVGGEASGAQSHREEEMALSLQEEHISRPIRVNVRPDQLARETAPGGAASPVSRYRSARGQRS